MSKGKEQCCGKATKFKKIEDSIDKPYYDRMHKKLTEQPLYAKKMSRTRSKTVEPVLGTLINFTNMKRVNTRGMEAANKHVLLSAMVYNLKKLMKFEQQTRKTIAMALKQANKSLINRLKSDLFCLFKASYDFHICCR